MTETKKFSVKKLLVILACVICVACQIMTPFAGLEVAGMRFLGIFVLWIALMATGVIGPHIACFIALTLAVVVGVAPFATAFSAYSGTTSMLLVGAFGMAAALSGTGVLNRIALLVMKLFPGTYTGQLWAVSVASLIMAPAIPSTAAKASILNPIIGTIAEEMGFKPHSKGMTGLLSCSQTITQFVGLMFLTGGVGAVLIVSMSGVACGWMDYLKISVVWGIVMFVLTVLFHQFYYNPAKDSNGEVNVLDKNVIQERIDAMGKMSKNEIIALIVLLVAVVLWITESSHGIPSAAVAIGAWLILACCGMFKNEDFGTKITWMVWANVAGVVGVVTLLSISGVASWLGALAAPLVNVLSGSHLLLILGIFLLQAALCFAMVNYNVTGAILVSMLASVPVSPICVMFAACMGSCVFFTAYQQVPVIISLGMCGGRMEHKDVVPAAWAYFVCNIIALVASFFWWKMMGLV